MAELAQARNFDRPYSTSIHYCSALPVWEPWTLRTASSKIGGILEEAPG